MSIREIAGGLIMVAGFIWLLSNILRHLRRREEKDTTIINLDERIARLGGGC